MLRPGRGTSGSLPSHTSGGSAGGAGGYGGTGDNYNGQAYGGYVGGSNDNNAFKDKRGRSARRGSGRGGTIDTHLLLEKARQPWVPAALAALFFFGLTMYYRSVQSSFLKKMRAKSLDDAVRDYQEATAANFRYVKEVQGLKDTLRTTNDKRGQLEREKRELQKERDELRIKHESPERKNEEIRLMARDDAWRKQVQLLQQSVSRESRRAALEKYGTGPHQVEITVLVPAPHHSQEGHESEGKEQSFVVEMAPLESVPHAVLHFLEQVRHGLWNDTWMYINGPHVMQVGPMSFEEADEESEEALRAAALKPFRDLQLDSLTYPEYSEDFPHVPWTLGYTGRPGGVDFYINKVDNSDGHGLGGQYHHELGDAYGDPCFAKVVKGFTVIKELSNLPTIHEGEWQYFFEEPVQIIKAVILEQTNASVVVDVMEPAKTEDHKPKGSTEPEKHEKTDSKPMKKKLHRPKLDHPVTL